MWRTAIVTGGTRGIGRAISLRLKGENRQVIAFYGHNDLEAERFHEAFSIPVVKCDVGDFEQCKAAVADVEHRFGPVDILVNNAGVTRDTCLHNMTLDQWNEVLRVDLSSVFHMTRQVIGGMRERRFGRIVNIASINGQKGQFGQTNYCAAKAGVVGFTKALALESAGRGVTVNAVAPGYIHTAMVDAVAPDRLESIKALIPSGRLGQPEEVARCVSFLVADDAEFITGSTLVVNGGQYMIG